MITRECITLARHGQSVLYICDFYVYSVVDIVCILFMFSVRSNEEILRTNIYGDATYSAIPEIEAQGGVRKARIYM